MSLKLVDPRLSSSGLHDSELVFLRCIASPSHAHVRAGCIFSGGESHGGEGRVVAWDTVNGTLVCAARLEAPVVCMVVVGTVRPAAPLRAKMAIQRPGAADVLASEQMVWAGLSNGNIAVLAGRDLGLRTRLSGHHASVKCICSPGAPPSSPTVGASVVLSGGEDGAVRLWDARTAERLRCIAGGTIRPVSAHCEQLRRNNALPHAHSRKTRT